MKKEKSLVERYKDALNYQKMFEDLAEEYRHEAEDLRVELEKQKEMKK